jgi:hypothetical protein
MNLPFGIRNNEHKMWVHDRTRTQINDAQQDGVALSYNGEKWRGEGMIVAGNYQINPDQFRERGLVGYVEYGPTTSAAFGLSALAMHSARDLDPVANVGQLANFRHSYGVFGRLVPTKTLVFLAEFDGLWRSYEPTATEGAHNFIGGAGMLQADFEPVQGFHAQATGEVLNETPTRTGASLGAWGTLQWFFLPHLDARVDVIYQSLGVSGGGAATGVTTLLAQLHLYL